MVSRKTAGRSLGGREFQSRQGQSPSGGRTREKPPAGVSHVVMQEEGDPVRGIVQEQQPLQEAGQERGRLFHKHSQKHPGGRLEGTRWCSEESPGPHTGVSSTTLAGWESPGAPACAPALSTLSLHPSSPAPPGVSSGPGRRTHSLPGGSSR